MDKYSKIIADVILGQATKIDLEAIDFEALLVKASNNRVLLDFCQKLSLRKNIDLDNTQKKILESIVISGEKNIQALANTIKLLDKVLGKENIPYLIVKTFKYIDYVTFDLDFLVHYRDFEKTIEIFQKNNITVKKHPNPSTQGLHQRNCFYPHCIKMDLHRKFFWLGVDHIDEDFVWKNTQTRKIAGLDVKVPSLEADFLLHNKQLVYERRYITLLDFLAIKYACEEKLNWQSILTQVKKHKWEKTFFTLLSYLNAINKKIFNDDIKSIKQVLHENNIPIRWIGELNLPFEYSFSDAMNVFVEIRKMHNYTSLRDIAYYVFSQTRYKINGRMPYYDHWYDFGSKYTKAKVIYK